MNLIRSHRIAETSNEKDQLGANFELFGSNSLSCYSYSGRSKGVCGYTHGRNAISNHQDDDVAADEDQDDNDDSGDDHENVDNGKKSNLTGT